MTKSKNAPCLTGRKTSARLFHDSAYRPDTRSRDLTLEEAFVVHTEGTVISICKKCSRICSGSKRGLVDGPVRSLNIGRPRLQRITCGSASSPEVWDAGWVSKFTRRNQKALNFLNTGNAPVSCR